MLPDNDAAGSPHLVWPAESLQTSPNELSTVHYELINIFKGVDIDIDINVSHV